MTLHHGADHRGHGLLLALLLLTMTAAAANGRGRHQRMFAVPVPKDGKIAIDGRLDDWDLSGQIEMFVISETAATQSAKFALMYDDEALYLGAQVATRRR